VSARISRSSNILMPAMDAYEFIRQLRCGRKRAAQGPRVVFSATGSVNGDLDRLAESCGWSTSCRRRIEAAPILGIVHDGRSMQVAACPPDFQSRALRSGVRSRYTREPGRPRGEASDPQSHSRAGSTRSCRSSQVRYRALFELSPSANLWYTSGHLSDPCSQQLEPSRTTAIRAEEFLSMTLGRSRGRSERYPVVRALRSIEGGAVGHGEGRGT